MRFWDKITSKNYWISTLVIAICVLLFESTVSEFILKYIAVPTWLLTFVSILIIILIVRLLTETILET